MGDEEKVDQRQFKVILLGDGAVGKTSIATRFSSDEFTQSYKQTIGLDFFIKHLILPGAASPETASFLREVSPQATSTSRCRRGTSAASPSRRRCSNHIFGAHAILLCYDITNYESFANLEDWRAAPGHGAARATRPTALARGGRATLRARRRQANKCDLSHMRAVKSEVHNRFADENVLYSFMMSAKSGDQHDPNVHSGSVPAYTKSKPCAVS
ncbi:GTPase [Aureococcus anophagefferens]|nr:GTPase [Aureococcus anophagefferens]